MITKKYIYNAVKEIICDIFETQPNQINMNTNLHTDLLMDSLDKFDLLFRLEHKFSYPYDSLADAGINENTFNKNPTVETLVNIIYNKEKQKIQSNKLPQKNKNK